MGMMCGPLLLHRNEQCLTAHHTCAHNQPENVALQAEWMNKRGLEHLSEEEVVETGCLGWSGQTTTNQRYL